VLVAGAALDALHALTALGYALSGRSRRRAGLVDAGIAAAFAMATFATAPMPAGDGRETARTDHASDESTRVPAVVTAAALAALAVGGWWLQRSRRQAPSRERHRRTPRVRPGTLRYRVPDHQDPAVLMAALANAEHRAKLEWTGGAHHLTIRCADIVAERPRVRAVIERTPAMSFSGPDMEYAPVLFEDEVDQVEA
jgi:hypothetical protein